MPIDTMTGLNTRHYFMNILEKEIARARRYGIALSVFIIDIDYFGKVDSSSGHEHRDQILSERILSEIGRVIKKNMRKSDMACRYASQQIAFLLPNSSEDNARMACERFRRLLHKYRIESHASPPVHIIVSIGLAALSPDSKEAAIDLVAKAYQVLQQAKKSGKNRVEGYK
ncbi:MAG: hypothetical protein DRH17_10375 [Deltaproteobacteria bacterium]|nr:MAG: hypothetical protein DRH17_10375 [Deltaproteobacteria bacterium]